MPSGHLISNVKGVDTTMLDNGTLGTLVFAGLVLLIGLLAHDLTTRR